MSVSVTASVAIRRTGVAIEDDEWLVDRQWLRISGKSIDEIRKGAALLVEAANAAVVEAEKMT